MAVSHPGRRGTAGSRGRNIATITALDPSTSSVAATQRSMPASGAGAGSTLGSVTGASS
ncbi:hypothetical protein [Actinophytocola sp.]|uniref:hypothetical protein n=1 Tax=Actinophytocola sp. TaxID=1872138 RepID=UPI003D69FE95